MSLEDIDHGDKVSERELVNVNHELKIIFPHIAKNAGNTIKEVFNISREQTSHVLPHELVPLELWESYYSFICVRHPIDRLLSSYFYHMSERYQKGAYVRRFPDLKSWNLETYFRTIVNSEMNYFNALMPQWWYLTYKGSEKHVDFVLRYEQLEKDLKILMRDFNIQKNIPHINKSKRDHSRLEWSRDLLQQIINFYKTDFFTFNYDNKLENIIRRYFT